MRKISVVIPVYNGEAYLRKCLDSLVNQSYYDFTIVVVNDGSTDSTLDILGEYDKKYQGMFKIKSIPNGGRSNARNVGISMVKTEFFTFLDSDDCFDKDMLLEFMQSIDKETDVVVCNCVKVINGKETRVTKLYEQFNDDNGISFMLSQPSPWGKLFRTSLFKDNDLVFPKDIKLYEDLAVIPRVGLYTNKIKYIDKPLYKYNIHDDSALNQVKFNKNMLDAFTVMDILSKNIKGKKYHDELEMLYIENLLRTSSLRFVEFKESYQYINEISDIMHKKYPNYQNNKYFKKRNYRFKLVCYLAYNKHIRLLKLLNELNKRKQGR